jgi:hypothetical protein
MSAAWDTAQRERAKNCPHDVNELLQKEREYMPAMTNGKGGRVWCDDCKAWVGFEFDGEVKP